MRARVILLAFLIFTSAPTWAEWVRVGRTDAAVHYVDPATVRKDGNLRRVWALQDMADWGPDGVRSIRALQEYDCADGRFRFVSVAAHSGSMAGGWIVQIHELKDAWTDRLPGAQASAIEKLVCLN